MHRNLSSPTPAPSPLAALDATFLSLARGIKPVTVPATLFTDHPTNRLLPVDQVRARLAHPSCTPETRARVWSWVAVRARREGAPWTTVACGFAVPALRRALARLPRLPQLDAAEVEQEALTALMAELAGTDPADPQLARQLIRAADRAAHRQLRQTRARHVGRGGGEVVTDLPPLAPAPAGSDRDEYTVLWQAVGDQIVTPEDADLIARTRLDLTPVDEIAAERGVSRRTVFRQRAAAEQSLGQALRHRPHVPPQG
ncbi:hypothetical protein [Streptomyces sp. NPDC003077]|uniref:hypothetical protein n=1 Tax=Streptomyces sp. NPDC003077 TaxID=3154443 RepID=UPI0033A2D09B